MEEEQLFQIAHVLLDAAYAMTLEENTEQDMVSDALTRLGALDAVTAVTEDGQVVSIDVSPLALSAVVLIRWALKCIGAVTALSVEDVLSAARASIDGPNGYWIERPSGTP